MDDSAASAMAWPLPGDNRSRDTPRLPGTSLPARESLPLAYIHQPAPSPLQYGKAGTRHWVLEFEPSSPPEIDPLTGWTGSRDPFAHIRLTFPDLQSAIDFAERQGWPYLVQEPPRRRFQPKSYADNLRYDLADAIARVQAPWDGAGSAARPSGAKPAPIRA
jgi:ETC complex I subunit conserved region